MSIHVFNKLITNYIIFNDQLKHNWIIIISSYSILIQWHEFSVQSNWHEKIQKFYCQKIKKKYLILNFAWFKFLRDFFCIIILNEAHQLQNLSFLQIITIFWLNTEFNFFLTATSFFNHVKNFKNLIFLIISSENDHFWNQFQIESTFNSFQVSDNDIKTVLCLTHHAIDCFIWNNSELLNDIVDHHIEKIWQHCLLYYCFLSHIFFDIITDTNDMKGINGVYNWLIFSEWILL